MEKSTNNRQTTKRKPPTQKKIFEFKEWWDSLSEQFKGQVLQISVWVLCFALFSPNLPNISLQSINSSMRKTFNAAIASRQLTAFSQIYRYTSSFRSLGQEHLFLWSYSVCHQPAVQTFWWDIFGELCSLIHYSLGLVLFHSVLIHL